MYLEPIEAPVCVNDKVRNFKEINVQDDLAFNIGILQDLVKMLLNDRSDKNLELYVRLPNLLASIYNLNADNGSPVLMLRLKQLMIITVICYYGIDLNAHRARLLGRRETCMKAFIYFMLGRLSAKSFIGTNSYWGIEDKLDGNAGWGNNRVRPLPIIGHNDLNTTDEFKKMKVVARNNGCETLIEYLIQQPNYIDIIHFMLIDV
jgi:hypothetical protein